MAVSLGQKMVGMWAVEKALQLDESEAAEKADEKVAKLAAQMVAGLECSLVDMWAVMTAHDWVASMAAVMAWKMVGLMDGLLADEKAGKTAESWVERMVAR